MQFISVNFDLNQKYYVDQEACKQAIKKTIDDISIVKINNIKTVVDKYGEQIEVIIEVYLTSKEENNKIILKISSNISAAIENLINSKPKNIQIKIKGDAYE